MIEVEMLDVGGKKLLGLKVNLPNAPLLLLIHEKLVVGCGYISAEAMERVGNAACVVRGVRSFQDMLSAEIAELTSKAEEYGLRSGMKVEEALKML
jgi:uncharacterized protein YunC (DUF1805 family)